MKKKIIAASDNSDLFTINVDPNKIYVDPIICVHLNDCFSEITAPMVQKVYTQHNQAAGLQSEHEKLFNRISDVVN